ncbi:hypothetical protein C8Q75DRAFT_795483 [Abortiporus biennis]|nr:hypothetical protein C8Q75DRAFT_795483 [Abortiporus biennis]
MSILQYLVLPLVLSQLLLWLLSTIIPSRAASQPDTTAVILNWSRFPNILLISSLLCSPVLNDIISEVFIWNNNPKPISYEDFKQTGCPTHKLRIHNSPENIYFQARFIACAQANTSLCFIQDDDYLIRRDTFRNPTIDGGIDIHTSFTWLGHGTMLHRSEAEDFLSLMHYLDATPDEMKMADNYYTILSNRVPEFWFDQGIELGGGQPFTVGPEGNERNVKYILSATRYLDKLVAQESQYTRSDHQGHIVPPYFSIGAKESPLPMRASCQGVPCVFETNIRALPVNANHNATSAEDIFIIEKQNYQLLIENGGPDNYLQHPPSYAVDNNRATFFHSLYGSKRGDYFMIDMLESIAFSKPTRVSSIEIAFLVNGPTERILRSSVFMLTHSYRALHPQDRWQGSIQCYDIHSEDSNAGHDRLVIASVILRECSVLFVDYRSHDDVRLEDGIYNGARFFRVELQEDVESRWSIYEVWLRER